MPVNPECCHWRWFAPLLIVGVGFGVAAGLAVISWHGRPGYRAKVGKPARETLTAKLPPHSAAKLSPKAATLQGQGSRESRVADQEPQVPGKSARAKIEDAKIQGPGIQDSAASASASLLPHERPYHKNLRANHFAGYDKPIAFEREVSLERWRREVLAQSQAQSAVTPGRSGLVPGQSEQPTPQAAGPAKPSANGPVPPTEKLLITFRQDVDLDVVRAHGGKVAHIFRYAPIVAAEFPAGSAKALTANPKVLAVDHDQPRWARGPVDLANSWGVEKIGAGTLHTQGFKGTGVRVAIIDSGIQYNHPDLDGNYRGGYDFVNNDDDPWDDDGHGTGVASAVAGEDDNAGVVGVAPEAWLYGVKVLDSTGGGDVVDELRGIEWAIEHRMQVINMSLGGPTPILSEEVICNRAYGAGIILFGAAGNDGLTDDVDFPGAYGSVVAVGATDINDDLGSFSDQGPEVELTAPGAGVTLAGFFGDIDTNMDGTSFSSPYAAGLAALILGRNDDLSASQVRQIMRSTALDLGAAGKDDLYGYGRIDAVAALNDAAVEDPSDTTPPGAVTDLAAAAEDSQTVVLTWTVPVDTGSGTAAYDVRWLASPITNDATFNVASPVGREPLPAAAGSMQGMRVEGLAPNTVYHFALKTRDREGNVSVLSNSVSATTAVAPAAVVYFQDDMESGLAQWTVSGSPPWAIVSEQFHSASNAWHESPGGDYGNNWDQSLTTIAIDLTSADEPELRFWTWYDIEDFYDYGYVEISTDGFSFTPMLALTTYNPTWNEAVIPLRQYAGESTVYIRFHFVSDFSITYEGWYIDDVSVVESDPDSDPTPPDAPGSLIVTGVSPHAVRLYWVAPGDDADTGLAARYDIRRSSSPILDDAAFTAATPMPVVPEPLPAGAVQFVDVTHLLPDVTHYFAVKALDEEDNASPLADANSQTFYDATYFDDDVEASPQFAGPPWAVVTDTSGNNTQVWTDSPGNYGDLIDVSLTSDPINLTGAQDSTLVFDHRYDIELDFDYASVEASSDGGANWWTVASYTGLSAGWETDVADLSAFDGDTALIVRYRLQTDFSVVEDGWSVDNIRVIGIANIVMITESAGSTTVSESGATDSYDVVLSTAPAQDVTITITPDTQTNLSSPTDTDAFTNTVTLVFMPSNWSTLQTVTVTAVDDGDVEPTNLSLITHAVLSADAQYNAVAARDVVVVITDNDLPAPIITQSDGSTLVTEGGAADDYQIVLNAAPTDDVTITISPDGQTSVSPASLTFTTTNWSTPQTVIVAAVDDFVDEISSHISTITHTTISLDGTYNGIAINDVTANVTDNDTAGVTITESASSTEVIEGGLTDTYFVALTSQPTANVTITIGVSDTPAETTVSLSTLTFTPITWDMPQAVTVTAVDDTDAENAHTSTITHSLGSSSDPNYTTGAFTIISVVANVTDNDVAGVTIIETDASTAVAEAGPPTSDSYDVVLNTLPLDDVTIKITPDMQTTLISATDTDGGTPDAVTLVFTTADWNTAQTVTVTAVDDPVAEGTPHTGTITHSASSSDGSYSGVSINNVYANIFDNDTPGVTITPSSTSVAEVGGTDTYDVVLDTPPTANVTFTISPDAQTTVSPTSLLFTSTNWNTAQTVTVTAVDDQVAESDPHTGAITHGATSTDGLYDGLSTIIPVMVSITDNDTAGVTITESLGSTTVIEGVETGTDDYTIVLTSQPTAAVTVYVTPDAETTVSPASLVFTSANWNSAQTVTVTAVMDLAIAEGDHQSTITHSAASLDAFYNGAAITIDDVVANIKDPLTVTARKLRIKGSVSDFTSVSAIDVELNGILLIPSAVSGGQWEVEVPLDWFPTANIRLEFMDAAGNIQVRNLTVSQ